MGGTACVPRELEQARPEASNLFRPYRHQALLQAGVHSHRFDDGTTAVDSFHVYHNGRGGYVLWNRHKSPTLRSETWLEVGPDYRPLRGWERAEGRHGRCEWNFVLRSTGIDVWLRTPVDPTGLRLHFATPARYTVLTPSVLPLAWGVWSARETETLWVLEFGRCSTEIPHESGFVEIGVEPITRGRLEVAGRSFQAFATRLRWPRRQNEELWISDPGAMVLKRQGASVSSHLEHYWSATGH